MAGISDYARGLSSENKRCYLNKFAALGGQDPYCFDEKEYTYSVNEIPQVSKALITEYLIFRISPDSHKEIRAKKSLDAFTQVASGWVKGIVAKKINENICVLGKVMHSQKISAPPLKTWLFFSK